MTELLWRFGPSAVVIAAVLLRSLVFRQPRSVNCRVCQGTGRCCGFDGPVICWLCDGCGLAVHARLHYGDIANLEYRIYGHYWPCLGAECACPARCLVHPGGVPLAMGQWFAAGADLETAKRLTTMEAEDTSGG